MAKVERENGGDIGDRLQGVVGRKEKDKLSMVNSGQRTCRWKDFLTTEPDSVEKTPSGKPAKIVLKTPYRKQDEIEKKTPSSRKSESDQKFPSEKQAASVLKTPHKQDGCVMKSSGSDGSNSDESCTPKRKVGIRRGKSISKEASKHINRYEEGDVSTDVEDSNEEMVYLLICP